MNRRPPDRTVRIIGGNWRGRKVSFADHDKIRPTPARIRETLFNWLQQEIHGARCLELYAGSGILSIEALSRGAAHVTLVEKSSEVMNHVQATLKKLCPDPGRYRCHHAAARDWLQSPAAETFDIVFLDPPFGTGELRAVIHLLDAGPLLSKGALVYMESEAAIEPGDLPQRWKLHRQKRAGQVHYCLALTDAA